VIVKAMSIEEVERLIRRRYHISKLVRLENVEITEYLAVFKFSNGRVVLVVFDGFDAEKRLFVFEDEPVMVVATQRLSRES
jgi:hypothetical protein